MKNKKTPNFWNKSIITQEWRMKKPQTFEMLKGVEVV